MIKSTNIKPSTVNKILDPSACFALSQIKALERLIRIKNIELSGGTFRGTKFIIVPNTKFALSLSVTESKSNEIPYNYSFSFLFIPIDIIKKYNPEIMEIKNITTYSKQTSVE